MVIIMLLIAAPIRDGIGSSWASFGMPLLTLYGRKSEMSNVNRKETKGKCDLETTSTERGYRTPNIVDLGDTSSQINGQAGAHGDGTYRTDQTC